MQAIITESEDKRSAELPQMALDFARRGETDSLAVMLRHGLPANLADHKGNTLLMLAAYNDNVETARMLLEHGGGVAFKGYEEIVALLLKHGADIDADNGGGMTPLMFAAMFGRTKVVEQLKRQGASLKRRNCMGVSAGWMVRLSQFFSWPFRRCSP